MQERTNIMASWPHALGRVMFWLFPIKNSTVIMIIYQFEENMHIQVLLYTYSVNSIDLIDL